MLQQQKKLNEQQNSKSNSVSSPKKLPHEDPKDWRVVNKPILDLCKQIEKEMKTLKTEQKSSFNQIEENLQNYLPKMEDYGDNLKEILPNLTKKDQTGVVQDAKMDEILERLVNTQYGIYLVLSHSLNFACSICMIIARAPNFTNFCYFI